MQQSTKPQIKIEQTATQRLVSGTKDTWLVAIEVRVTNVGKVKVELGEGKMVLSQINPLPGEALIETELKDLVLEPGEGDQAIFRTYQVPDSIKTVQIQSNYSVPGGAGLSWNLLSILDIGSTSPQPRPEKASAASRMEPRWSPDVVTLRLD